MVDMRCANPDLQLDVDLMIVEYMLYQAVAAQFELLAPEFEGDSAAIDDRMRVVSIFDSFLLLSKATHPFSFSNISPAASFNLDVLEFLVLLATRFPAARSHMSDTMLSTMRKDTAKYLQPRRRWLAAREKTARRLGKQPVSFAATDDAVVAQEVEMQICKAWTRPTDQRPDMDSLPSGTWSLLFDLIPRFMQISDQIAGVLDQDANESWMDMAGQFMLQASIESLRLGLEGPGVGTGGAPDSSLPRLEDCFAWGHLHLDPEDPDASLTDLSFDSLSRLFHPDSDQKPQWTKVRAKWLSEFSIAPDSTASSQLCRLERLAWKYPLAKFQESLVEFLRWSWDCMGQDEISGKPILVQIEEGHLRSLGVDGAEFDDFMVRTGLKKSYGPVDVNAVDYNGLAKDLGLKDYRSANTAWLAAKKKLLGDTKAGAAGDG